MICFTKHIALHSKNECSQMDIETLIQEINFKLQKVVVPEGKHVNKTSSKVFA